MLLHTIFPSDAGFLELLFGRLSFDLQSDGDSAAEPVLLPQAPSSRTANNCNRSTLMFARHRRTAEAFGDAKAKQ